MKEGLQYKASDFALRAIALLIARPGLTASDFGMACWPHLKRKPTQILASWLLKPLVKEQKLLRISMKSFWKASYAKPRKRYYVTDYGFTVYDYYARRRANSNTSHAN